MKCSCYKIKYLHTKCNNVDTCNLGITNILNLAIILNLLIIDYCHDFSLRKNIENEMLPITVNCPFFDQKCYHSYVLLAVDN